MAKDNHIMNDSNNNRELWKLPDGDWNQTHICRFMNIVNDRYGLNLNSYADLHGWSISQKPDFWLCLIDYADVRFSKNTNKVLSNEKAMPGAIWFTGAKLNFAENCIQGMTAQLNADDIAIYFQAEDKVKRQITVEQLQNQVGNIQSVLNSAGLKKGDRVAAFMPNMPETVSAMLATTANAAIWSSCSPDFGVKGVVERFGQIEPKILFCSDKYFYNGKPFDCMQKVADIVSQIPSVEQVIVFSFDGKKTDICWPHDNIKLINMDDQSLSQPIATIEYQQVDFDHPLYIMYSSGTTGVPKCIVHGTGGTLIQHKKEHLLHANVQAGDRLFYFTTCGWMMWNWLVTGMASGARLVLYDGSPFYPSPTVLWDMVDELKINIFGTSAKYIDALRNTDLDLKQSHNLGSLKTILSTGSALVAESFDYVYETIKTDVCLSSISGGTDIVSCFALGVPIKPVIRGELQCIGLGMDVAVLNDDGQTVVNEKGDLACLSPFPSMPVGFWNDADGSRYHQAYFAQFENIWCHGDYAEITEQGGMIIYGRSDATLNPGGVRIGTAEIYRQVEALDEIEESIAVGQLFKNQERIVLFVVLSHGLQLDELLQQKIKQQIRSNTTPRHVPEKILQVTEIPRTKSGKIVELAVRQTIHGDKIKNIEALANPEALAQYSNLTELEL